MGRHARAGRPADRSTSLRNAPAHGGAAPRAAPSGGEKSCPAPVFPLLGAYVGCVEQHSARTPHKNSGAPTAASPLPRPARPQRRPQGATAVRGGLPRGPLLLRAARLRRTEPRLTGLGTGVFITLAALAGGAADSLITGEPGTLFGVVFLLACLAAGLFVRPYDLSAAPVSAPIAFTIALAVTADGEGGGFTGHVMGLLTGLATLTGWLYGGTVGAAMIAAARKVAYVMRERRR